MNYLPHALVISIISVLASWGYDGLVPTHEGPIIFMLLFMTAVLIVFLIVKKA